MTLKKHIVEIHKGKKASFYRPNTTLYLILKLARFSETDLTDCLKMLELHPEELKASLVKEKITSVLKEASGPKYERIKVLERGLNKK